MASVTKIVLLIVIALIFFWIDYVGNPCLQQKWEAIPPVFFHHLVVAFVAVGWMFDSPLILVLYIAAPLVIFVQHCVYHYCIVTEVTNKICDTPGAIFTDVLTIAGIDPKYKLFLFAPFIALGLIIASCKLYRILKRGKAPTFNKRCDGCDFECILPERVKLA